MWRFGLGRLTRESPSAGVYVTTKGSLTFGYYLQEGLMLGYAVMGIFVIMEGKGTNFWVRFIQWKWFMVWSLGLQKLWFLSVVAL